MLYVVGRRLLFAVDVIGCLFGWCVSTLGSGKQALQDGMSFRLLTTCHLYGANVQLASLILCAFTVRLGAHKVPIYYLANPQPRERAWKNHRGKKTLLSLTLLRRCEMTYEV